MAIEKDVAADIASELASLQAEQGSEPEEAAPEADSVEGDPEADEESEEIEEEPEDEPIVDGDAEAFKSELAELIDAGDLKAAAEKLGLDLWVFNLTIGKLKGAGMREVEAEGNEG